MRQQWGYRADGSARIFDLEDGDSLPAGWLDSPDCIEDESRRTAEVLSEACRLSLPEEEAVIEQVGVGEVRKRRGRPPKAKDESAS